MLKRFIFLPIFVLTLSLMSCPSDHTVGGTVSGIVSGTLVLELNNANPLTITSDGTYVFGTRLPNNTNYKVAVQSTPIGYTCSIANGSGTVGVLDIINVNVTCSPGSSPISFSWTDPTSLFDNISSDGQNVFSPEVAMDNNGNAIVVWEQYDGSAYRLFKSEFRNGAWTHPASLADSISPVGNDVDVSHIPQVAMDNNGNAIIAWVQYNNFGVLQIYVSEYRNSVWTHPASLANSISVSSDEAFEPHVAMDDNNNALVTWTQIDGPAMQIFKAEYRNGGWTYPTGIHDNISPDAQHAFEPIPVMDNNGNALIVWRQGNGTYDQVFKAEYRNGAWTYPASLSDTISPSGTDAGGIQAAMDNNDNAIVTWTQYDGINDVQVFKAEYRNGTWTLPTSLHDNISLDGYPTSSPQVAMNDNGEAIISWLQSDGTDFQVFKAQYRTGAWTFPALPSDNLSPNGQSAVASQVAMDNNGDAVLTWYQLDGTNFQIFRSEYRNGIWTSPSLLSDNFSPDGQNAFDPQVAMSDNGQALIVWKQFDGTNDQIFMSEYR